MFALRIYRVAAVALVAILLSGCYFGRTSIRTSDGGAYDIYADGRYICSTDEECSVTTRGAMGKTMFEAQKGETVVGHEVVSRDVTAATFLWMPFTYFLSIFLYQAYPDEIVIPVDPNMAPAGNSWGVQSAPAPSAASGTTNTTGGSVWDKPIY